MDYRELSALRENHASLRLLRANSLPFIGAFLWRQFTSQHLRIIAEEDLVAELDAYRLELADAQLEAPSEMTSLAYLRTWVEAGYLRQYYIEQDDTPRYELTPATDKALDWLHGLRTKSFIGTESRLRTIFDLLRNLREETEANVEKRIALLEAERQRLDAEIARVAAGDLALLTPTQVRERFAQVEDLGRQLLRDFSEVEQNFRLLDRAVRTKIARLEGNRGEVLGAVFNESDVINESEQGRSFTAFFEFLMSADRRDELDSLLCYVYDLDAVAAAQPDRFLARIQASLLDASDQVMGTRQRLTAQLRRFLDEHNRRENSRIMHLLNALESEFLEHKQAGKLPVAVTLDDLSIDAVTSVRLLYRLPLSLERTEHIDEADGRSVASDALFTSEQVDERVLRAQIRRCLDAGSPASLAEVLTRFPLKQGLGELVAYLKIASSDDKAVIDLDEHFEATIASEQTLRVVKLPQVLFSL